MNRHQSINLRQLCLGYFLYSTSIKILALPATLAQGCGNWAWVAALIGVIFEIVLVALSSLVLHFTNHQNKFFRILCWLLLPVTIAEIWLTALQIYRLAYVDLFTDLGIVVFVITLILIGLFFITRQPRAMFRTGEILWLFFAFGLVLAIIPTLYNLKIDWAELVQGAPAKIIPTAASNLLFFESASFILAFGSETKRSNRDLRKINLTAILCGVGYIFLIILMVLLFGSLLRHKGMGLIDLTTASQFITNTGSLDWLIATAILATLILRFGIQLVALVTLLKRGLNKK